MDGGYFILFGLGLGLMAFLIWMLFPIRNPKRAVAGDRIRGYCPICGQGLRKGERVRSSVTEIGNFEIRTTIKGCPYCLGELDKRSRSCPVCKKRLDRGDAILAISDPRVDKKRLSIRGCKQCYPQGFE
jgi:hypothetical protein